MASRQLHGLLRSRRVFSFPQRQPTTAPFRRNTTATAPPPPPPPREPTSRLVGRSLLQVAIFTTLGFALAMAPAVPTLLELRNPPSNAATLALYTPPPDDDATALVETYLATHPAVLALRADPGLDESRPHLKIPAAQRPLNLTAGTLAGPGRLTVPPLDFTDRGAGQRLASVCHIGANVCGHPGIVHGGLLATLLDESLARCCFAALPHKMGMTASLTVNYRAPLRAGSYVVIRCETTRVEGRKAWVKGRIETLVDEAAGETPVVVVEAEALFVSPKSAATMAKLVPV